MERRYVCYRMLSMDNKVHTVVNLIERKNLLPGMLMINQS